MGCTLSRKQHRRDSNPRVFSVINLDDQGQERNPGKIEITETHLVLTQRGKEPIRWPLNSLRRYGYEEELFSFESGRKSPTGPGIYAFKCRRAEALFNLLQDCIQRAGHEEQRLPHPLAPDSSSRPTSLVDMVTHRESQPVAMPPDVHLYINGTSPPPVDTHDVPPSHEYVNYNLNTTTQGGTASNGVGLTANVNALPAGEEPTVQYAELLHSEATASNGHIINGVLSSDSSSQPVYINVPASSTSAGETTTTNARSANVLTATQKQNGKPPMLHRQVQSADPRNYTNVALGPCAVTTTSKPPPLPLMSYPYAELDLANSVDNVSGSNHGSESATATVAGASAMPPASPTSHTSSPDSPTELQSADRAYATIDFGRTKAMQDAKLTNHDDGTRKTRHNSNVEELNS